MILKDFLFYLFLNSPCVHRLLCFVLFNCVNALIVCDPYFAFVYHCSTSQMPTATCALNTSFFESWEPVLSLWLCGYYITMLYYCHLLILLSSDVHMNPGPRDPKVRKLNVCHCNIRGLNECKMRSIKTSFCNQYDVITLSETFLNSTSSCDLSLQGFHPIIRKDRRTFGGGVAVYIRESLIHKRAIEYEINNELELLWIELNTIDGKMLIGIAYRPPQDNEFWNHLDENIEFIKSNSTIQYMMLIGDMNADHGTPNGRKLAQLCINQNLQIHIMEPTRITATSSSCLDQILTNFPNFVYDTHVDIPLDNCDHCTVAAQINFKIPAEEPYHRDIWLYKDADQKGFQEAIMSADWDECFVTDDINDACVKWTEKLIEIAKLYIPNKTVLIRPKDKPWYNNNLRKLKRKVKRKYKKAKSSNLNSLWNDYKAIQNEYVESLKNAEQLYKAERNNKLKENRNSKSWWNVVNDILGKGGSDSYPTLEEPGTHNYIYDSQSKATAFNNLFLTHSTIDTSNAHLPADELGLNDNTIEDVNVTENEVLDILSTIDTNKSSGPDNVSAKILRLAGSSIVPSLTKLIKLSLQKSIVPDLWKSSNVIPIHKKDSKSDINNYRPISLLPIVSKILEKIVFKAVYNFLHANSVLSKHQSGFRPNDSTVNQLAFLYHEFCKALDEKKDIRIVFCDISRAFDRVWHLGLLYKLKKVAIRGNLLDWFHNYLYSRKQKVVIKGKSSEWGQVTAGVPQGSVLGPLLFISYINLICAAFHRRVLWSTYSSAYFGLKIINLPERIPTSNFTRLSNFTHSFFLANYNFA